VIWKARQPIGKNSITQSKERAPLSITSEIGETPTIEDRLRRDRKFKAFWAVFLMASVMAFLDKLNGVQYVDLVTFVFGLYMAGNVGEHWTKRGKES
jgi:hypothetical protein